MLILPAHEMGDSVERSALPPACTGSLAFFWICPGACAPGSILPPASRVPRTTCFALLRSQTFDAESLSSFQVTV